MKKRLCGSAWSGIVGQKNQWRENLRLEPVMTKLFNWLLEEEHRGVCRAVGIFLLGVPLIFTLAHFSPDRSPRLIPEGFIFSTRWFEDIFGVIMTLMAFAGIILIGVGFTNRKEKNK
jgi:hypothetical protein